MQFVWNVRVRWNVEVEFDEVTVDCDVMSAVTCRHMGSYPNVPVDFFFSLFKNFSLDGARDAAFTSFDASTTVQHFGKRASEKRWIPLSFLSIQPEAEA